MNKIYFSLALLFVAQQSFGEAIMSRENNSDNNNHAPLSVYTDAQSYTQGGLTFTYPAGWFKETPKVKLGLEAGSLTNLDSVIVTTIITSNMAEQLTVRVNIFDGSTVREAKTGEVIVHMAAHANP